jgi:mannose-6-phosphate isomerase-like protein (cupin superfamily)
VRIFDVTGAGGRGPVWGLETDDLNATLLTWRPGEGTPEHVNEARDVLVLVVEGSGRLDVDGEQLELRVGQLVVVPKGARRQIAAGPGGIRYLTVHRRRGGLGIAPPPR